MFNPRKYFKDENQACLGSYRKALSRIKRIHRETAKDPRRKDLGEYYKFFHFTSGLILEAAEKEKTLGAKHFSALSLEELGEENRRFFQSLRPENYESSYANPAHCVKVFGEGFGQLLSFFYMRYSGYHYFAFLHMIFMMEKYNRAFIEVFEQIKNTPLDRLALKQVITAVDYRVSSHDMIVQIKMGFDPSFRFYRDVLEKSDLSDFRYLYRYGRHISRYEHMTAKFLLAYPATKIRRLARLIVQAYIDSFRRDNKDLSKKSTVLVMYTIGQEPIARQLVKELKKKKMQVMVARPGTSRLNEQFDYDHRFDDSLHMDINYISAMEKAYYEASESRNQLLRNFSGVIALEKFGEPPFIPQNKPECLKYDQAQQALLQDFMTKMTAIRESYSPSKETSFTAITFPSPEIGPGFERIFEDILEINMLDAKRHERIQQTIIDTLDRAESVWIKGKGSNRTDILVKLECLDDPKSQTNFVNCGANVNIPLGEVYTSPKLAGTNGTLHFEEAFLNDLLFRDLVLEFRDGYISSFSSSNFADEAENKKYIEENLLHPHKTLPMGEFAIGTNTMAYVLAKKHGIMKVLPMLILEKTGPHFAIGDTCFAREEDKAVYNPDGKEIVARDNEKTRLRCQDQNQAYTHAHTDITLAYESIEHLAAVFPDGLREDIIRDGRFVLKGTGALNKPFNAVKATSAGTPADGR